LLLFPQAKSGPNGEDPQIHRKKELLREEKAVREGMADIHPGQKKKGRLPEIP